MKTPMTGKKKQQQKAPEKKADKLAEEIGGRIYKARDALGLSQQAVQARTKMIDPDKVGVSRAALSLYETGTNKPGAREITLLCEVLKVSPNWLLFGSESPAKALQPTTVFLTGDDLAISTRLAFAMLALNPIDRDSLANLVFSMLTGKLSDTGLSGLMVMANMMQDGINKQILDTVGKESAHLPLPQLIDKFVKIMAEPGLSNWGTLRRNLTEEEAYEGLEFPPRKPLE